MRMKIHPNSSSLDTPAACPIHVPQETSPITLTVWRKSLLFNCNGFTVFDSKGNLVYRVDNYSKSGSHGEIVLMDAAGKPLLTIRRKAKLILGEQWGIYEGESTSSPRFSVRKRLSFFQPRSSALARVAPVSASDGYEVEGSYKQRRCLVLDEGRRAMAEISKKEATGGGSGFGPDVFRLVVQPSFDAAVAMAIIILLEEMIGSKGWFGKG